MSVMELIGQAEGTVLYGDRPPRLVRSGSPKLFKAPFRGFVKSVSGDGETMRFTITINGVVVCDIPSDGPTPNNSFEAGDTLAVFGAPTPSESGDRVGVHVGVLT